MAELRGILSKLSGSAVQFAFKRVNGHIIMSEKASITTVRRSRAQQLHRMKWPNLIKTYAGIAPLLNCAFKNKSKSVSDYNMFVNIYPYEAVDIIDSYACNSEYKDDTFGKQSMVMVRFSTK